MSVKQRPPQRSLASRTTNLRPAAATRRAAAMPAAPAPRIKTAKSGCAAGAAADGRRRERRPRREGGRAGEKCATVHCPAEDRRLPAGAVVGLRKRVLILEAHGAMDLANRDHGFLRGIDLVRNLHDLRLYDGHALGV